MDPQSHSLLQFVLSVAVILLVIFALEEDKISCDGSKDDDYRNDAYSWFNTLNTLTTVPLGCSIIAFMYTYTKVSESTNDDNNNETNEEIKISKAYIIGFIFQPCLPLILLLGAIIEFLVINKVNTDCFNHGLNVGVSIICDGIAILLLIINVIIHLVIWIKYRFKTSSSSKKKGFEIPSNIDNISGEHEQEKRLSESVSMNVVIDKEGEMENEYTYVNNLGSTPSINYVNVPKNEDVDNNDEHTAIVENDNDDLSESKGK